jgi:hypothetical protein
MSRYLVKGVRLSSLTDPSQVVNTIDCSSAVFFDNLATKLMDMSISIQKQMEELKKKQCAAPQAGFLFASITAPKMILGVAYEYVEYVTRYGPPVNGKFDPVKLEQIRIELGIVQQTM